jgi:hypothetical protein
MKNLALDQVKGLAQQMASPGKSIFLPTQRAGRETQQAPIRFKNLLRDAEKQLLGSGMGPREAGAFNHKVGKVIRSSNGQGKEYKLALLDFKAMNTVQNEGNEKWIEQNFLLSLIMKLMM